MNAEYNHSDDQFGEYAGKQSLGMALGAIIYSRAINSPRNWTPEELNYILLESNGLYYEVRSSCDDIPTSGYLRVNNFDVIKHNLTLFKKNICLIYADEADICGLIKDSPQVAGDIDLQNGVENVLHDHSSALLTAGNKTVAIMKLDNLFFVFNSHSCDSSGHPSPFDKKGTACLIQCSSLKQLVSYCKKNLLYEGGAIDFSIHSINLNVMDDIFIQEPQGDMQNNEGDNIVKNGQ